MNEECFYAACLTSMHTTDFKTLEDACEDAEMCSREYREIWGVINKSNNNKIPIIIYYDGFRYDGVGED